MTERLIQFYYPDDGRDGADQVGHIGPDNRFHAGNTGIYNIVRPNEYGEYTAPGADGDRANTGAPAVVRQNDDDVEIIYSPVSGRRPTEITDLMGEESGEIIIDDTGIKHKLNSYERWVNRRKRREKNAPKRAKALRIWNKISPVLATLVSLALTFFILKFAASYVNNKYLMPVDPNDPTPITVTIPSGSGAAAIAKLLYEAGGEGEPGLIPHKAIFKVYVDFKGKSGSLKAGTYVLSRNMSIPQMVDIICTGNPPKQTIKFTVAEGMTVESIGQRLVELGVLDDSGKQRFLQLCITGASFAENYQFIKTVYDARTGDRPYLLEGYLFPDTYEVYVDASEEDIINKMLTRFGEIYSKAYADRAEELGLTMDEVVILASMIEKEAKTFDFTKVSAVFHNRLELDMMLGSDATLEYILKTGNIELTQQQLLYPSPYNTHIYKGLPAGPVSNPGAAAIEAVLYPDEQYMEDGYLYFCLMDSSTGALVFAKTEEEHAANVEKYRPNW